MSPLVYSPQSGDGAVVITFELEVEQPRSREFLRHCADFAFFDLEGGSAIDRGMTGAALGLPLWVTINVIPLPKMGEKSCNGPLKKAALISC